MQHEVFDEIVRLREAGRGAALTLIVESAGSSPQKEGAKMVVRDDGSIVGSLGGGCLEATVIDAALQAMQGGRPQSRTFKLTEKHGDLACGGKVRVYIEPLLPNPQLIILGAGHVGRALSGVAGQAGFRVTVVDDREEYANPANLPEAERLVVSEFGRAFEAVAVDRSSFIVIATRGHLHDYEALTGSLATEARYIGLLSSRRKKAMLFARLAKDGFGEQDLQRIHTPVGLPIGSVTPAEIGVSITAQLIQVRRAHEAHSSRTASGCGALPEDGKPQAVTAA